MNLIFFPTLMYELPNNLIAFKYTVWCWQKRDSLLIKWNEMTQAI